MHLIIIYVFFSAFIHLSIHLYLCLYLLIYEEVIFRPPYRTAHGSSLLVSCDVYTFCFHSIYLLTALDALLRRERRHQL